MLEKRGENPDSTLPVTVLPRGEAGSLIMFLDFVFRIRREDGGGEVGACSFLSEITGKSVISSSTSDLVEESESIKVVLADDS